MGNFNLMSNPFVCLKRLIMNEKEAVDCPFKNRYVNNGSACGTDGRAVDSDTRGRQFKSRHQQVCYGTFI